MLLREEDEELREGEVYREEEELLEGDVYREDELDRDGLEYVLLEPVE